jgi:hypothetical protein
LVAAYGEMPEFVLLGGLVPDLLCSGAANRHIGTTDVDVQVDLEVQGGSVNAARLERALRGARPIAGTATLTALASMVATAGASVVAATRLTPVGLLTVTRRLVAFMADSAGRGRETGRGGRRAA